MVNIETLDVSILGKEKTTAAYLIQSGERALLFDCGPESQFDKLTQQLAKLGLAATDITDVLPTHIHLDHAGAAWRFAGLGATIYLHPFGAPHLINPDKFLASAKRIYQDKMQSLWGTLAAIDEDRVKVVTDNELLKIGNIELRALFTPGHAKHHISWLVEGNIFSGDVCGCRIKGAPVVAPTPPPDLDFKAWENSLQLIESVNPARLYLTHYGSYADVSFHIAALRKFLGFARKLGQKAFRQGITLEQIGQNTPDLLKAEYLKFAPLGDLHEEYQVMTPMWMNAQGIIHYWKKQSQGR